MKIFKMTVILMGVSFGAMAGEAEGLSQILKKIDETNPLKDLRSISLIGSQSQQTTVKVKIKRDIKFDKDYSHERLVPVLIKLRRYSIADANCHHIAVSKERQAVPGQLAAESSVEIEKSNCKTQIPHQPAPQKVDCILQDTIRGGGTYQVQTYDQCLEKAKEFLKSAKPYAKVFEARLINFKGISEVVVLKGREPLLKHMESKE